jgi:transposase
MGEYWMVTHRIEQWDAMTKRHLEERKALIRYCLAHQMTQTEAAQILGVSLSGLNKFVARHKIIWPGQFKRKRRSTTRRKLADLNYGAKGTVNK